MTVSVHVMSGKIWEDLKRVCKRKRAGKGSARAGARTEREAKLLIAVAERML